MRTIRPSTKRILDLIREDGSGRYYDLHKPPSDVRREAKARLCRIDYAKRSVTVGPDLAARIRQL